MYRICKTLDQTLRMRGYAPGSACTVSPFLASPAAFITQFGTELSRDALAMVYEKDARKIVVLFSSGTNVGKQQMLSYVAALVERGANEGILVVEQNAEHMTKRSVSSVAESVLETQDIHVEVFEDRELVFFVLDHELQPRYELVPPAQHAAIFSTFVPADKLPRMRRDDMVSRLLGFRPKDIVRVTYPVETSGTRIEYFCVV